MKTLTEIAWEHDRLVNKANVVDNLGHFAERLAAMATGTGKSGEYMMRIPKTITRSGRPGALFFDLGRHQDREAVAYGAACPEALFFGLGPQHSILDIKVGHGHTARSLSSCFSCMSSESPRNAEDDWMLGALWAREDWDVILKSCGFASDIALEQSPYKIIGLSVAGNAPPSTLIDYQLVEKNSKEFSFNVESTWDVLSTLPTSPTLELPDLDIVLEQVEVNNAFLVEIASEHEETRRAGSVIMKENRYRVAKKRVVAINER